MKELQQKQLSGEELEQASGSEDESYQFPAHEADRVHVKLTKKVNDSVKKEYVDIDKVVKLVPAQFERMVKNESFAEYDSQTILHDPRPKAAQKTEGLAAPGAAKAPMQPVAGLPSLQDAQNYYQELFPEKKDLVAGFEYDELLAQIREKDADFGVKKEAE